MNALTPQFRFGNIQGVESVSYSLSRGIQPSVCTVQMPLNVSGLDRKPKTMYFSDGIRTVQFADCIISDVSPATDGEGFQVMSIAILDRRWKYSFGQISGTYNVRTAGEIQSATKKTPRELATLIFEAMGEKKFDVSRMPNDTYPFTEWNLSTPGAALEELCDAVNAYVCLGHDDVLRIFKDDDGQEIPNSPSSSSGKGFDFGAQPGQVGVASGLMMWEFDFPLEPVGLDVDGKIKPIDELSFVPDVFYSDDGEDIGGWKYVDPVTMNGVQGHGSVSNRRETYINEIKLAKETVWRWYRIGIPEKLKTMPLTQEKVISVNQFFPLLDHQIEYETISESQKASLADSAYDPEFLTRKPQLVWGQFYAEDGSKDDNTQELLQGKPFNFPVSTNLGKTKVNEDGREVLVYGSLIYPKGFRIDQDRRIVVFSDPVYKLTDAKLGSYYDKPKLYLRTACNFYNDKTRAGYRQQVKKSVGGPSSDLVAWTSREDLLPSWYKRDSKEVNNLKEIEKGLNYYVVYAMQKYRSRTPAQAEFPYLLPFGPDGKIAQVTFSIDGEGFIGTQISKELEALNTPVTYQERKKLVRDFETAKKLQQQAQTQDPKKGKK